MILGPGTLFAFADTTLDTQGPRIDAITPSMVDEVGGDDVVIEGAHFWDTTDVTVDGVSVAFVLDHDAQITITTDPHASGATDVGVTTPIGTATKVGGLAFAGALAAPSIASVSPDVAGIQGGGNALTITGTGFVSGATVAIGGVAATSVTWVSATEITCVPGAHVAGVVNVVVTNPDTQTSGVSGIGLVEYWSPSVETLGLLLSPGSYLAGVWPDDSGNGLDAVAPDVAPAEVGGCPDITAATEYLSVPESIAEGVTPMATLTAGTIVVIFEADTAAADAIDYSNPALVAGAAASPNASFSDAGFKAVTYDEDPGVVSYVTALAGATSTGSPHIGFVTWGSTLRARVDGGSFVSTDIAANALSNGNVGPTTEIGRSYAGADFFDGRIMLVAIAPTVLSDATCDKFRSWGIQRGLL